MADQCSSRALAAIHGDGYAELWSRAQGGPQVVRSDQSALVSPHFGEGFGRWKTELTRLGEGESAFYIAHERLMTPGTTLGLEVAHPFEPAPGLFIFHNGCLHNWASKEMKDRVIGLLSRESQKEVARTTKGDSDTHVIALLIKDALLKVTDDPGGANKEQLKFALAKVINTLRALPTDYQAAPIRTVLALSIVTRRVRLELNDAYAELRKGDPNNRRLVTTKFLTDLVPPELTDEEEANNLAALSRQIDYPRPEQTRGLGWVPLDRPAEGQPDPHADTVVITSQPIRPDKHRSAQMVPDVAHVWDAEGNLEIEPLPVDPPQIHRGWEIAPGDWDQLPVGRDRLGMAA